MVKIEIDGKQIEARDGDMVIEAADDAGIYIPRFCYHKKLSVAANCRMCLVEVEKARKPLPACATPVTDGMKVSTKSKNAIAAQKGVMEFLLINHPLDCPICDQGGECELQDVAMGYGKDVSRFTENKRVVADKNLGSLISTDMTRCIHCTRCVRFGEEVAGIKELGATGRGEHMQIGTYIEQAVESEMSGNVIDLCPVGALTSKPFRFSTRSWEMQQKESIAAHDCVGTNVHLHVKSGKVMRAVPKENESINETWMSDRDRFSYQGINSEDRASSPMIKQDGEWKTVDWETALNFAFSSLNKALNEDFNQVGFLATPNATTEELYLFQKLARSQGVTSIDHRLRQLDFSHQAEQGAYLSLGQSVADLESLDAALFIGSNVRKEQPIVGHRIRKAAVGGAKISFINTRSNDFRFPVLENIAVSPSEMQNALKGVLAATISLGKSKKPSKVVKSFVGKIKANDAEKAIASSLLNAKSASVVLGAQCLNATNAATLEFIASTICEITGAKLGYLADGSNSAGASLAGVLPHRIAGGNKSEKIGKNAQEILSSALNAYVLLGTEAGFDVANAEQSIANLTNAECVISMNAYVTDAMKQYSTVILPTCNYVETAGTFVNAEGVWQNFNGVVPPVGEARPAWKVLRVLGNLFEVEGFDYMSVEDIFDEVHALAAEASNTNLLIKNNSSATKSANGAKGLARVGGVGIHSGDAIVRRASALQITKEAMDDSIPAISAKTAKKLGLQTGDSINILQGDTQISAVVRVDEALADNCVCIPMGTAIGAELGCYSEVVDIQKAENNAEEIVRASNA